MRWYSRYFRRIPVLRPRAKRRRQLRIETLESREVPHVSGLVFLDANANGIRDTGESGIAGVGVRLFQGETEADRTETLSDATFAIANLILSTDYQLRIDTTQTALANRTLVTPDEGSDDSVDSDMTLTGTDATVDFTTLATDSHFAFDAGFATATGTLSLGDLVF